MKKLIALSCAISSLLLFAGSAYASTSYTYTTDADFDMGTLINVNHDAIPDQLQLLDVGEAFDYIWVAASARGTIIRIDTNTGAILGEYRSAPEGRATNPSRTTVDANGNVWAGNRAEVSSDKGSVVHVGLLENGQCVDRNSNGSIDTSSGLSDIKNWDSGLSGVDDFGGVITAEDECIIHYVRTAGTAVRTVAVDGANNVWVGGFNNKIHELYDSSGNLVAGSQFNAGCGGYGGLVDGNGILWSASLSQLSVLRYDPSTSTGTCVPIGRYSYGLGIDSEGDIWNTNYNLNTVMEIAPDGIIIGTHPTFGANGDRGVAVSHADDNVWVANSFGSDVSRLDNTGAFVTTIVVGNGPTGVAVDANGKIWATNLNSNTVSRIDPATNLVDLTVNLGGGAGPYNYSDMTGSTLTAPPGSGTWSVVHDSGIADAPWNSVSWNNVLQPGDSSIVVTVASSTDDVTYSPAVTVINGAKPAVPDGQYLSVSAAFTRSTTTNDSPILEDLTVVTNMSPVCTEAYPSVASIWPPNHKFVDVDILGVTDPDGDSFTITIDTIFQDEPVDDVGDGAFVADGIIDSSLAQVRAERSGDFTVLGLGNGRVYHIGFTATDALDGMCSGEVLVDVPLDKQTPVIDEGAVYDSTQL